MMKNRLTDPELWEAVKKGSDLAFKTLYERYWSKVYTTAYAYLKDREICEDITHEIFLTLWMRRERLEISSLQAYLTSVSRYEVYRQLKLVKNVYVENTEDLEYICPVNNDGESRLHQLDLKSAVHNFLELLPKRCREIFLLSREEHFTNQEIADRLSISRRSVENQITIALKHLRASLKHLVILFILGI